MNRALEILTERYRDALLRQKQCVGLRIAAEKALEKARTAERNAVSETQTALDQLNACISEGQS